MLAVWVLFVILLSSAEGENSTCRDYEFPCYDGSCIDKKNWCDIEFDCKDGTDEMYCYRSSNIRPHPNNCTESFFRCEDGPCIPLIGRCDGYYSCSDRSDEKECTTLNESIDNSTEREMLFDGKSVSVIRESISSIMEHEILTVKPETHTPTVIKISTSSLSSVQSTNWTSSVFSNTTDVLRIDIEKDFVELNASQFVEAKIKAQRWLLKIRNPIYGWDEETARAFTALHLSDDDLYLNISEKPLMTKELHLKILAALLRNESTPITLADLSLYMNALTASCENTKNFYSYNLVQILRQRTDFLRESSKSSNPLVYITLCLNGASTKADLGKIKEIVHGNLNENRIGVLALASLAATCISRTSKFSSYSIGKQVASHLSSAVAKRGLPDNVYDLALVTQALNEARINQNLWNRSDALKQIINEQDSDGSFGNILSTYYAIPVLSGKSLLSVKHCSAKIPDGSTASEDVQNGGYRMIRYSLYFGEPITTSISLMVPVTTASSLFDIMQKAAAMNPSYELRYSSRKGKPIIYSIGGVVNDPEYGMYWKLYLDRQHSFTNMSLLPYEDDPRLFVPAAADSIVYWMKSVY